MDANPHAYPMSLLLQEMRRTYAAQRGVSQGASITLAAVSGGFEARFECAKSCGKVFGKIPLNLHDIPILFIPMEDAHRSISKLAETFSVALVDTVTDECGSRFVLVWKIAPTKRELPVIRSNGETITQESIDRALYGEELEVNLDEY